MHKRLLLERCEFMNITDNMHNIIEKTKKVKIFDRIHVILIIYKYISCYIIHI